MRRPGFLAGMDYWFGSLSDLPTPKRWRAGGTMRKAKGADHARFRMIAEEGKRDRLRRLQMEGLYTPGQGMDIDYSNLVHYGTIDRSKIAGVRRAQQEWQRQENIKRYGTTDIKQIMKMAR